MIECNQSVIKSIVSNYSKIIVELGMGNGKLLEKIAGIHKNLDSVFIGIEINTELYKEAISHINLNNVILFNSSFNDILPTFPDNSIDKVISILPAPEFIDQSKQNIWQSFYRCLFSKLKKNGIFQLVTELTDDLFEPVADDIYYNWIEWLVFTFQDMGYKVLNKKEGHPKRYSTRFLDQFKGDTKRIRMVTLNLKKSNGQRQRQRIQV